MAPERSIEWNFETNDRFGSTLMEVENLSLAFGERKLFEGATFTISPGERLGIIGRNGTGKSSLLKILTGVLSSSTGEIHRQSRLQIGILDQNRSGLKLDDTVYESVGGADFVDVHGQRVHVAGFLAKFLFGRTMLDQKVLLLSGGERARLLLAKLLLQGANLLVLDEPTNDLDLLTLRALEEALLEFGGGVLVVTHDRAFLDRVCTGILSIEEEQVVSYADRSQVMAAAATRRQALQAELQAQKDAEQAKVSKPTKQKSGLSYKEKKELEALPDQIEEWENQMAEIDEILLNPETYTNPEIRVAELQIKKEGLEAQIDLAMERWEELSDKALD
jgi:ATP-binding cassette subfamily F protein uup